MRVRIVFFFEILQKIDGFEMIELANTYWAHLRIFFFKL